MKIPFTKMHGIGNSYIFLDLFSFEIKEEMLPALAIDISNVNTGIGSDGLILIHPSKQAEVGMRIFNKDGSEGKTCGNGLRCVAKYAYENNLVTEKIFTIETKAGNVTAEIEGNRKQVEEVTIDMGEPKLKRSQIPMIGGNVDDTVISERFELNDDVMSITAVSMGNPHAVFFVDDINQAPLYELGPVITDDERFPESINVEFVEVLSNQELNFRVWERGSGVTQACGSGACAAVVSAVLNGYAKRNQPVIVHLSGGDLTITWTSDNQVWMKGRAETTTTGIFFWNQ